MYNVAVWRCDCTANLKAVTWTNVDDLLEVFFVECPTCGRRQIVQGLELVSIVRENVETPA